MLCSEIGPHKVVGYFHAPYYSMRDPRNAGIRFINVLKNDFGEMTAQVPAGEEALKRVLEEDFSRIVQMHGRLRDVGNPMFNLSREEIAFGATVIRPNQRVDLKVPCGVMCQQGTFWS